MMKITEDNQVAGVDKVLQLKEALAYVQENTLIINDSEHIRLPEAAHVTSEPLDNYNIYVSGNELSHIYKLDKDKQLTLLYKNKADGFVILNSHQFILIDEADHKNTLSYYIDGVLKWRKAKEKKRLSYNLKSIVTSPHYKYPYLEVRDLATFTVQKVIDTDKNYKVSHHTNVIDDTLIFFQTRRLPEFTHIDVIATAINLTYSSIQWTSAYQGAYWFLFNDRDQQLYSLRGVWVNKHKTYYLETLNPKTGETSRTLLEQNTDIVTSPWLAKIVNNTLFYADSGTKGTCISAIDLTTKKRIARCDLHLAAGVKIAEPYIAGDDLWVLDTEKTLHQLTISG
jgi:hypothetical protein